MTTSTQTRPGRAPRPLPTPRAGVPIRTLYPPAVPGGIVLRLTRSDADGSVREAVESPAVPLPGQAMRAMRRTARAYGALMTPRSRVSVERWFEDEEELYAALASLSNRVTYQRSWTLRNHQVLTLAVVPAGAAVTAVPPAVEALQHREVPSR